MRPAHNELRAFGTFETLPQERLRSDPGKVRGESLRYRPDAWMVWIEMPDKSTWWVIWRQPEPDMVDVLWIGAQPGPDPVAYSTET